MNEKEILSQLESITARLKRIVDQLDALDGDSEDSHKEADDILCQFLRELECSMVADAFERARKRLPFWYA